VNDARIYASAGEPTDLDDLANWAAVRPLGID
jgi:hypothetical protein